MIMLGLVGGVVVALALVGLLHPRSSAEVLGLRPPRSPEQEAEEEADDVAQMLEAINRSRRARGKRELTEDDVREGRR